MRARRGVSLGRAQLASHLRAATPLETGLREKGPERLAVGLERHRGSGAQERRSSGVGRLLGAFSAMCEYGWLRCCLSLARASKMLKSLTVGAGALRWKWLKSLAPRRGSGAG